MIFVNRKAVLDYLSKNDSLVFDSIEDFVYGEERFIKTYTSEDIFEWIFVKEVNDNIFAILGLGKERVPYFRIENRSEFASPEEKDEFALSDALVLQKMAKDWAKKNMKKKKKKRFLTPFD